MVKKSVREGNENGSEKERERLIKKESTRGETYTNRERERDGIEK